MPELLIRPGANDHEVIRDLLTPGAGAVLLPGARPLIDRLVLDAHVAKARPDFVEAAGHAGVPVLVDPLTVFWQGELREADKWSQLPFGEASRLMPDELANDFRREKLVAEVVTFEIEMGATAIIPPYLYAASPNDPHFEIGLDMLRATSRYMARNGIALPVIPVFCARLQSFGPEKAWREGVDRFASVAVDLGPEAIAVCLSPAGALNKDSYNKVFRLFAATRRVKRTGTRVFAWRQGIYGPGLVAAGHRRLRDRDRHPRADQPGPDDRLAKAAETRQEALRRRRARHLPRAATAQRHFQGRRDPSRAPLDAAEADVRRRALLPQRRRLDARPASPPRGPLALARVGGDRTPASHLMAPASDRQRRPRGRSDCRAGQRGAEGGENQRADRRPRL